MKVKVTLETPDITLTKGSSDMAGMVYTWHLAKLIDELISAYDAAVTNSCYKLRPEVLKKLAGET